MSRQFDKLLANALPGDVVKLTWRTNTRTWIEMKRVLRSELRADGIPLKIDFDPLESNDSLRRLGPVMDPWSSGNAKLINVEVVSRS